MKMQYSPVIECISVKFYVESEPVISYIYMTNNRGVLTALPKKLSANSETVRGQTVGNISVRSFFKKIHFDED